MTKKNGKQFSQSQQHDTTDPVVLMDCASFQNDFPSICKTKGQSGM